LREARQVFTKEVLCLLRDRHTVLYSVFLPLFLYPGLVWLVLQISVYLKGLEERSVATVLMGDEAGGLVSEFLAGEPQVRLVEGIEGTPVRTALVEGRIDAALRVRAEADAGMASDASGKPPLRRLRAEILYSGARSSSQAAADRLVGLLEKFRSDSLAALVRDAGLGEPFFRVLDVERRDISSPQELANYVASLVLPLLMVFMTALGALYPALEATVGEKERGTLETTLVSPVSRVSIVLGKYAAVVAFALAAFLLNSVSMSFTFVHLREQLQLEAFRLTAGAALLVLGAASLLALLLGAVMMVLGFLARTFREGQSYVVPVYLLALVPTLVATSPGTRLTAWVAAVPVVNVALLFRDALRGGLTAMGSVVTLVTSLLYAAGAVALASLLLRREDLATGGEIRLPGFLAAILGRERRKRGEIEERGEGGERREEA
jgi:sodium transport system permease protein